MVCVCFSSIENDSTMGTIAAHFILPIYRYFQVELLADSMVTEFWGILYLNDHIY